MLGEKEVAVFDGGAWAVVTDLRGVTYYDQRGLAHTIIDVGVSIPSGCLVQQPPKDGCIIENGQWVVSPEVLERETLILEYDSHWKSAKGKPYEMLTDGEYIAVSCDYKREIEAGTFNETLNSLIEGK